MLGDLSLETGSAEKGWHLAQGETAGSAKPCTHGLHTTLCKFDTKPPEPPVRRQPEGQTQTSHGGAGLDLGMGGHQDDHVCEGTSASFGVSQSAIWDTPSSSSAAGGQMAGQMSRNPGTQFFTLDPLHATRSVGTQRAVAPRVRTNNCTYDLKVILKPILIISQKKLSSDSALWVFGVLSYLRESFS